MPRPRIAFVVQRCHEQALGGSEALCLALAQQMAAFADVEILTTCAVEYRTWANDLAPGEGRVRGLPVLRFPVASPREAETFDLLCGRIEHQPERLTMDEATDWMRRQGPDAPGLADHIRANADRYDAIVGCCYLYKTTYDALQAAPRGKRVLQPSLHDEWMARLPLWKPWFAACDRILSQTPEESALLAERFPDAPSPRNLPVGVPSPLTGDAARFRAKYGITGPFLLCLGRVERGKGTNDLAAFHHRWRTEAGGHVELVLAGPIIERPPVSESVRLLGRIPEEDKWDALAACTALVNPSAFESLSFVLLEAWQAGRPALVNAACAVTAGQCRRTGFGLSWSGYHGYRAAIEVILQHPDLAVQAPAWVEANHHWPVAAPLWLDAILGRSDRALAEQERI
ncbi:hexosyltransferase [Planctomycetota bacterium]|nr:hexosyltransferase [Planctomycetota bacterium]